MDFGIVRENLSKSKYFDIHQMFIHIGLIFENAFTFNSSDASVFKDALVMQTTYKDLRRDVLGAVYREQFAFDDLKCWKALKFLEKHENVKIILFYNEDGTMTSVDNVSTNTSLSIIRKRLACGEYIYNEAFERDVKMMFTNYIGALMDESSNIYKNLIELQTTFELFWNSFSKLKK